MWLTAGRYTVLKRTVVKKTALRTLISVFMLNFTPEQEHGKVSEIDACFGGAGAVPGAIVGGAIAGIISSECIGRLGEIAFDEIYTR